MSLRIVFERDRADRREERGDLMRETNGLGWPKDTWFQKRLRYVREQQRRKEIEFVYECSLGTITFRQPLGAE